MQELAQDLWVHSRKLRFFGVETGSRMTVVRMSDGGLFVHSPSPLDRATRERIDALGPVRAVVAPSLFHHMHAGEWMAAYPNALGFCCPGLEKKRADLSWDGILGDSPEGAWRGELEQVYFRARTMEHEVVFFHRASRSLICADAVFNLSRHPSALTRAVALLLGQRKPGATWLEHIMIRDRTGAREQVGRMLDWDCDRIVLSHGPLIERHGSQVLASAYAWL